MTYAIMVDYHMWDEERGEHDEPMLLGLEGNRKIFIFDPEVTGRTKIFNTLAEAVKYIAKHKLKESICYDNARVVIIST